ncbi:MAG: hypothetical protein HZB16_15710 [Armatimonadetes bacterium]|nr:hypothetical protein [Armatimonadota bacterium]
MADGGTSWWKVVKAAFSFRFPVRGLGGVPLNFLCLAAGAVFALLFAIAGQMAPAAGVVLLTTAYELAYLYFMASLPRFRAMVGADVAAEAAERPRQAVRQLASQLSRAAGQRLERISALRGEIESLLTESAGAGESWVDALRTGGLADIEQMSVRLLWHQERLRGYLASGMGENLPKQIELLEREVKAANLSPALRDTKQKTLDVLRQRWDQLDHMRQTFELAGAELDRLEQHLGLLRDQAAAGEGLSGMAEQIDSVVTGITDTAGWLTDSERMLGDDDSSTESVDTTAS